MGVSYNRLWKFLIDKNMKRIEVQNLTDISENIFDQMEKNCMSPWKQLRKFVKNWDVPLMK